MTFDIGLHEVCVRTGVRYVITKFSEMDSLPNFLTRGAPLRAREARAGAPLKKNLTAHAGVAFSDRADVPFQLHGIFADFSARLPGLKILAQFQKPG